MKERFLATQRNTESVPMESFSERDNLLEHTSRPSSNQVGKVGTVVKVRWSSLPSEQKAKVVQVIFLFFIILYLQLFFICANNNNNWNNKNY
jgi:hypothetical protein